MPCYHPLPAWFARHRNEAGNRVILFKPEPSHMGQLQLPCGRCIGCRLERSRQWAVRCMHEAQLHPVNYFATLTYDQDHLPPGGSLRPRDFVLFMKRLRKATPHMIRFFQCGEYGERLERPHHHALLFNCPLPDARPQYLDSPLMHSRHLEALWGNGHVVLGNVTFNAAAYVARYALKKVTGPPAEAHYRGRLPEYLTMSRRPGIGSTWLQRFKPDVYPHDQVILRGGVRTRPPRYYDNQLPKRELAALKLKRIVAARDDPESTGRRLIIREAVTTANVNLYRRDYP